MPTKVLLALSDFIRTGWMMWVPGLAALAFGAWYWSRSAMGRQVLDRGKLSWPVLGPMFRNLYVARFSSGGGAPTFRRILFRGR